MASVTANAASAKTVSIHYKLITLNVNGVVKTIRVPLDDDAQENTVSPIPSSGQAAAPTAIKRGLTSNDLPSSKKRKLNKNKKQIIANSGEERVTPISNNPVSAQQGCSGVNRPHAGHAPLTSSLTKALNVNNAYVHSAAGQSVTQHPSPIVSSQNNCTTGNIVGGGVHTPPHNINNMYAQFQIPINKHITIQSEMNPGVVPYASVSGAMNSKVANGNQFQTTSSPSQTMHMPYLYPQANIAPNGNKRYTTHPLTLSQPPNATVWSTGQVLQHSDVLCNVAGITRAPVNCLGIPSQQMVAMTNQTTPVLATTVSAVIPQANIIPTTTPSTILQLATLAANHPSQQSQNNTVGKHPKPINSVAPIRSVNGGACVTKYPAMTTSTVNAKQSTTSLSNHSTVHITKSKTDTAALAKKISSLVKAVKNNNKLDEARLLDSLSNSIVKKSKQHKSIDSRCVKLLPMTNITKSTAEVSPRDVKTIRKHKQRTSEDKPNYNKNTSLPCTYPSASLPKSDCSPLLNIAMAEKQYRTEKSERKKHKKKRKSKTKNAKTDIKPCSVVMNRINMHGKTRVKIWEILPQLYPDIFATDNN